MRVGILYPTTTETRGKDGKDKNKEYAYVPTAPDRYFHHVRTHVRPNGERFPTVFDDAGVPAHYPTCLMLNLRAKNVAAKTLSSVASDLIHLGQLLCFAGLEDLNARLEQGHYLDDFEIEAIADLMGLKTKLLRRLNDPKVVPMRRDRLLKTAPAVFNPTKSRRITSAALYMDLVARTGEAQESPDERRKRSRRRREMVAYLKALRPKGRSSRVRNAVRADDVNGGVKTSHAAAQNQASGYAASAMARALAA